MLTLLLAKDVKMLYYSPVAVLKIVFIASIVLKIIKILKNRYIKVQVLKFKY